MLSRQVWIGVLAVWQVRELADLSRRRTSASVVRYPFNIKLTVCNWTNRSKVEPNSQISVTKEISEAKEAKDYRLQTADDFTNSSKALSTSSDFTYTHYRITRLLWCYDGTSASQQSCRQRKTNTQPGEEWNNLYSEGIDCYSITAITADLTVNNLNYLNQSIDTESIQTYTEIQKYQNLIAFSSISAENLNFLSGGSVATCLKWGGSVVFVANLVCFPAEQKFWK